MAIRIKHRVWIHAARDTSMKNKLFGPDAELSEVVSDGFDKQAGGVITVAASGNENLSLGDITAVKGIYLEAEGEAQVKLNGSSDALVLQREPDYTTSGFGAKLFIECDISAVNVINPSSTAVLTCSYMVWGDPTP